MASLHVLNHPMLIMGPISFTLFNVLPQAHASYALTCRSVIARAMSWITPDPTVMRSTQDVPSLVVRFPVSPSRFGLEILPLRGHAFCAA